MNVVDELLQQRDAVMFGTWVPRPPMAVGEACAVVRTYMKDDGWAAVAWLGHDASDIANRAFRRLHPEEWSVVLFNNSGRATREDILEVLDEAIRLAKEDV